MFERDYTITGKHATYLKFLAVKNSKDDEDAVTTSARIFERYIDVYMNGAIWGLLYLKTVPKDTTSDDRARIYADAYAKEQDNCIFLYRMVMLLDKSAELTTEERLNRAFRYDSQPDKADVLAENMELFHSYVRGGIELMYEQFTDGCTSREDYLEKIHDIVETFSKEIEGYSYEKELAKLMR